MSTTSTIDPPAKPRAYTPRLVNPGYPVNAVRFNGKVVGTFASITEAAGVIRRRPETLKRHLEAGTQCGGHWWRYADMPATAQPLQRPGVVVRASAKRPWVKPVEYQGVPYPSIAEAARALGLKPKTMWMRLNRKRRPRASRWDVDVAMATTC